MRLGILGGTFDPIHNGHLLFGEEAFRQLNLDKVLFMLTPSPPHKEGNKIADLEIRLEMLTAVISDSERFVLSDIEVNRPGPHYTVDTVKLLKQAQPGDEIIFLMGADSLMDLPEVWHTPQVFVDACDGLGVFNRAGFNIDMEALERKIKGITEKTFLLDAALIDVSSTEIRKRVSAGKSIEDLVPPSVNKIILEKKIYT